MKTGKAAKALGIDQGTIYNWIATPKLTRYFSLAATGKDGKTQRDLTEGDVIVLNTIREMRGGGITDWDEIAQQLETGVRNTDLPAGAVTVDTGTSPIYQYARTISTAAERDQALALINDLKSEVTAKNQVIDQLRSEKEAEKERLLREMSEMQSKLYREIGKLEGQLEVYRTQKKDSDTAS